MSTADGPLGGGRDDRADRDDRGRRGERIGVGSGDDSVTRIQLAARWAEVYAPASDSLAGVLRRFRGAYDYLDAVTHGVEPNELDEELATTHAIVPPLAPPLPPDQPPPPQAISQPEPRPWA